MKCPRMDDEKVKARATMKRTRYKRFNLRCNRAPAGPYQFSPTCAAAARLPPTLPPSLPAGGQLQEGWEQGMSVPAVIRENQKKEQFHRGLNWQIHH